MPVSIPEIIDPSRELRDAPQWAPLWNPVQSDPARLASALDIRKVVQILPHGFLVEVTAAIWGETPRGVAVIAHGTCDLAPSRLLWPRPKRL